MIASWQDQFSYSMSLAVQSLGFRRAAEGATVNRTDNRIKQLEDEKICIPQATSAEAMKTAESGSNRLRNRAVSHVLDFYTFKFRQSVSDKPPLHFPVAIVLSPARSDSREARLGTDEATMSDTKSETATVETLGKIMDQLARQIGVMNPDGPQRKVLIDEISDLGHIKAWLRTETSKEILQKADELARELALLKIGHVSVQR